MKKYLFITILTCMMLFLFGCEKKMTVNWNPTSRKKRDTWI